MPFAIAPLTDPALECLAEFLAEGLNTLYPGMVRRWIASELPSFRIEEYPLIQLQCLKREGESLERCRGSIRYLLPNDQLRVGSQQQTSFPYVAKAIARQLGLFDLSQPACGAPLQLVNLPDLLAETRTGPLTLLDGGTIQLSWVEILFEYRDHAELF